MAIKIEKEIEVDFEDLWQGAVGTREEDKLLEDVAACIGANLILDKLNENAVVSYLQGLGYDVHKDAEEGN